MSAGTILDEAFTALIALTFSVVVACALTGRSRASHYRRLNPPARKAAPVPQSERAKPPSTLSQDERANVLAVINSAGYADLSIWRESGLGAPQDIDELQQCITGLEQQAIDLRLQLEERDQDLTAARGANRELMTRLNTTP